MTITTDTTLLHDPRRQAALLYWQGFSVPQIAAMLQMKRPTVQSFSASSSGRSPLSRRVTICSSSLSAFSKLAGASFFFGIMNV